MKFSSFIYRSISGFINLIFLIKTQVWYKLFFKKIGSKTRLIKPMMISNPGSITLSDNVLIRNYARLEVIDKGEIFIGDNSTFEQGFHITCGKYINIGNNVTASFDVMITDIDHDYTAIDVDILDQKYIYQSTIIGNYCFLGAGVRIQAGTILGKQCVIGTNSVVRGKFPDYCVIVGSPAKIVKRYDTTQKVWRKTDASGNFL